MRLRVWTLLLTLVGASPALATASFGFLGGYGVGVLARNGNEAFTTYPILGYAGYNLGNWNLHAYFQSSQFAYGHEGRSYYGAMASYGVGGGYIKKGKSSNMVFFAQAPVENSMILIDETSGDVNGFTYRQSTMTTMTGGLGYAALGGWEWLQMGTGRPGYGGNLYYGLFLGYTGHQFAKQTTRIKTNNSILAPTQPAPEDIDYKVNIMSVMFEIRSDL